MAYSSTPGLTDLQNRLQSTQITIGPNTRVASTLITQFLQNPNVEDDWDNMNAVITQFMTTYAPLLAGLRVLVTLSDGTVAYDTYLGASNTFANYINPPLGLEENHNTRISIMVALLGSNGIGNEVKISKTTGVKEVYTAIRMGLSTSSAIGCVRVSANSA